MRRLWKGESSPRATCRLPADHDDNSTHEGYMTVVDAFPTYYKTESPGIGRVNGLSLGMDARSLTRIAAESRAIKCAGYSALLRLHRLCLAPALRSG
jgi:hypothetical protein